MAIGALPAGLSLNAGTAVISGTPTGSGSSFTLKVTDSKAQSGQRALSISIQPKPSVTANKHLESGEMRCCHCREISVQRLALAYSPEQYASDQGCQNIGRGKREDAVALL